MTPILIFISLYFRQPITNFKSPNVCRLVLLRFEKVTSVLRCYKFWFGCSLHDSETHLALKLPTAMRLKPVCHILLFNDLVFEVKVTNRTQIFRGLFNSPLICYKGHAIRLFSLKKNPAFVAHEWKSLRHVSEREHKRTVQLIQK